nr:hypothetical protein [Tanacetum cinerariifolium]
MGDENPRRTLRDYSRPSYEGYWNTIEAPNGNDLVNPITRQTIDQAASGKLHDKNDEESWALLEDLTLYDNKSWNDLRDFAKLVKAISMPHDVPSTFGDEGEKHEQIIDKNMVELNNYVNKPIETSDEPLRKETKEFIREERKMAELPEPQPVSFYLNHKINEKLIGGLIGNPMFNDSFLAMETGKMKCEDYHSLPKKSIRKAFMFKRVTRKIGMEGNFVIPCNIEGTKDISTLFDQGSDVNVMPLCVYNRLTDEKLVETNVRLALASNSQLYPLGVAEDMLVKVTSFVYPVDFMILDIKEDVKKPLILGTLILTMARAEIKFNKGTISLRSRKSTVLFHISPAPFPILEERER